MRILVVSDTHIPASSEKLPAIIEKEAKKSDCCLHCGDMVDYSVFEMFKSWTKTYAVCGNMDSEEIQKKIAHKQIINFEGITLGLIHGRGNPNNLINYIDREFADDIEKIDIFVFGHSHCSVDEIINGKIYFNPGSLTDKVYSSRRSYGILEIKQKKLVRRIVEVG